MTTAAAARALKQRSILILACAHALYYFPFIYAFCSCLHFLLLFLFLFPLRVNIFTIAWRTEINLRLSRRVEGEPSAKTDHQITITTAFTAGSNR